MRTFLCSLWFCLLSYGALAAGLVNLFNTQTTLVLNQSGPINGPVNSWYFGLFTAAPEVTNVSLEDLVSPVWTFTGLYATNLVQPGRIFGGAQANVSAGWEAGDYRSFAFAGWSSNLGHDWDDVSDAIGSGLFTGPAEIGVSQQGLAIAGGLNAAGNPVPTPTLFGTAPLPGAPVPIPGFTLLVVPEPQACTLVLLSLASFLSFRRSLQIR